MLSIQACFGVDYLLKEVGKARLGYYADAVAEGEPPGRWFGDGARDLGLSGVVEHELMAAIYDQLLDPRDEAAHSRSTWGEAAALASGHRRYRSPQEIYEGYLAKEPTAGPERREELRTKAAKSAHQAKSHYDVTFSAPKSWSVAAVAFEKAAADATAAGDAVSAQRYLELRDAIETATRAGAAATIEYLQDVAGYSRVGKDGLVSVDAHRFVVAQFLQHDSRNHDPQLHVHQAVFNRVQCPDGQWRALDGQALFAHKRAADAVGMRVAEAELAGAGFWLVARPDGMAREIAGVSQGVMTGFSSRRQELEALGEDWVDAYRQQWGREPSGPMRKNIYEQACLATRKAKSHLAETTAETLERYEAKATAWLEGGLARVAQQVTSYLGAEPPVELWSPQEVIAAAVGKLSESHQRWRRADLLAEINSALPAQLGLSPERVRGLLDELTDAALADSRVVALEDEESTEGLDESLILADGRSAYGSAGGRYYTTGDTLAGEQVLRDACVTRGAPVVAAEVAAGWVARFAESGVELGADQRAALVGVLTSGAWVESIVAAAGTGKSFTVEAIGDAWAGTGGRVFALASGQNATDILAEDGLTARNITQWLATQDRLDAGGDGEDAAWRLSHGDLVVVDEAGMTPTADLVQIQQRCAAAGVKLLLTGDPAQLAAVGAGGALADVAERAPCYELTEVRRFNQEWEAQASLGLRDRDTAALAEYAKRARIHDCGTVEQAESEVATAWLADHLAGKNTLAIVGTNETAARVSAQVRSELANLGRVSPSGVLLARDGVLAGEGDLILARKNGWNLLGVAGNTTAAINKHTYRVQEARADGSLVVRHVAGRVAGVEQLGPVLTLPTGYVREHVTSGYAATVHAAQGATVDTAHSLITPGMDAGAVYTGMSRGRESNIAHVAARVVGPDAPAGQEHTIAERVGQAVLADILAPEIDTSERGCSALRYGELAAEKARSVKTSMDRLVHETGLATAGRVGAMLDRLVADGALAGEHRQALAADQESVSALGRLLRAVEISGRDPQQVLAEAVGAGSLDDARSPGRVLYSRISAQLGEQLAPRISSYVDLVPKGVSEAQTQRLTALAHAAEARRCELGTRLAEDPPRWALTHLGPVPAGALARAEWEHAAGWVGAHRELAEVTDETTVLGTPPSLSRAEHHAAYRAAHAALGVPDTGEEEAGCSNALLAARVRAWEREQAWLAPYVGDELASAHEAAQQARQAAALKAAQAEAAGGAGERQRLSEEAAGAARAAEVVAAKIAELERLDLDRGRCWAETAVTRDKAERARVTLGLRGVDVAAVPADVTTAAEWLDAERADRAEEDGYRRITDEAELADALTEAERAEYDQLVADEAGPVVETAVPDIRDGATVDPVERADLPARPVPTVRELAAQVNRAHTATVELANRWRDEQAIEQAYQDQLPGPRTHNDTEYHQLAAG